MEEEPICCNKIARAFQVEWLGSPVNKKFAYFQCVKCGDIITREL